MPANPAVAVRPAPGSDQEPSPTRPAIAEPPSRRRPRSILVRGALFAAAWAILTGAEPASWIIGAPAVIAATWVSLRLAAPRCRSVSVAGLLRFGAYFLRASLSGGIDVAQRVLRPRLPIEPGLRKYRMRLRDPAARVVFVNAISLLPGTLSADLDGDLVRVHALDARADVQVELQALERRVAALFDECLAEHFAVGEEAGP